MSGELYAFQQGLQIQPTLPQRFPARRAIPRTGEIPAQACDFAPEPGNGELLRRKRSASSYESNGSWFKMLQSRRLRHQTRQITQLHQAHGHGRHEPQQAHEAVGSLHLTGLDGAARFEELVVLFTGISLGLVDNNRQLLRRAVLTEMVGAALVLATAILIGSFYRAIPAGTEILSRTAPNSFDLFIALAGGAAGPYGSCRRA